MIALEKNRQMCLNDINLSRRVFLSFWAIYASAYLGRTCYSAAMTQIVSDGLFTKPQVGIIGTAFFICYGMGQIINGFLGDKLSPFKLVLTGTFLSSLCCLAMCFQTSNVSMAIVWGINGIAQSMLWSPMLRVFSSILHESVRRKACLYIALSLPCGTTVSYLVSTVIVKHASWKYVFAFGFAVLLLTFVCGVLVFLTVRGKLTYAEVSDENQKNRITQPVEGGGMKLSTLAAMSALPLVAVPTLLHGMLRDGISTWVPTMLTETYAMSASFSIFLTVILPIFNAFGAFAITPIYKKFGENELKTAAVCCLFPIVPLSLLLLIGKIPVLLGVLLLALTTASMYSLNYLLITRVPVRFVKYNKTATVSGILNACAYVGCAASVYGFGFLSARIGWQLTILTWLIVVAVMGIGSAVCIKKWTKFISGK